MLSPPSPSSAGAAEALQRRRRETMARTPLRPNNDKDPSNPQLDRFESHLEAIREQLDKCLKGIADNEDSLKALRQRASVNLSQPRSSGDETKWRPSVVLQQQASEGVQSSQGVPCRLSQAETDRMKEIMRARRFESGSKVNLGILRARSQLFEDVIVNPTPGKQRRRSECAMKLWKLLDEPESSRVATWASRATSFFIAVSMIFTFIDASTEPGTHPESTIIQLFCDSFFSLELLARFYSCPSRKVFLQEVYTLCEIVASFPILAVRAKCSLDGPLEADTWPYVVLIGFAPVLRLLMVLRRFEQIHLQLSAFRAAAEALPVMLYTLLILIAGFAVILFVVEPRWNIPSFNDAVWLTIVTCFTVGYGDKLPVSELGRFVMCLLMISSALYMAIPIGIVGDAFSRVWAERVSLLLVRRMSTRLRFANITASDIPTLFHSFDRDENGSISRAEFIEIIQFMGVNLDDAQALALFNIIDADGSGEITDEEFVKILFPCDFEKIYNTLDAVTDIPTPHPLMTLASVTARRVTMGRALLFHNQPDAQPNVSSEGSCASIESNSSARIDTSSSILQYEIGLV